MPARRLYVGVYVVQLLRMLLEMFVNAPALDVVVLPGPTSTRSAAGAQSQAAREQRLACLQGGGAARLVRCSSAKRLNLRRWSPAACRGWTGPAQQGACVPHESRRGASGSGAP